MLRFVSPLLRNPPQAERPWVWAQHWLDVLFLHWRVPAARLRPHVPSELVIDTYDQNAWLSLVLFRLKVRPRGLPCVPWLSSLLELNVRTYVRGANRPGIYFLRMLADNRLAIAVAKLLTPLPYCRARMSYRQALDGFHMHAMRLSKPPMGLDLSFRPHGKERQSRAGSLEAWLVERYRLFVDAPGPTLLEATVSHPPWPVQDADVAIEANTMSAELGFDLSSIPETVHYSRGVDVRFGGFEESRVDRWGASSRPERPPWRPNLTPLGRDGGRHKSLFS